MKKIFLSLLSLLIGLVTGFSLGHFFYTPQPSGEYVCHVYGTISGISPKTSDGYVITMDTHHSIIVAPSIPVDQNIHRIRILPDSIDRSQDEKSSFTVEVIPLSELSVGDTVELSIDFLELNPDLGEIVWIEGHASVWEPPVYDDSEEDGR